MPATASRRRLAPRGLSTVQLSNSRVHGLEAIRGDVRQQGPNALSLPPLSVLGAIGLPLILVAILLEFRYLYLNTQRARARSRKYLHRWRLFGASPRRGCGKAGATLRDEAMAGRGEPVSVLEDVGAHLDQFLATVAA